MNPTKTQTTVYIESLGCAKNQVDSEVMLGCLEKDGFSLHDDINAADIIIVNTCAFIAEATSESIDTILEYAALKRNGSCRCLIVCGCLPQRYREDVAAELPEVDLFLGSSEYGRIAEHIRELTMRPASAPRLIIGKQAFLQSAHTPRSLSAPGASAYIKIAEGCSHGCTYCAIPSIKGPFRQRIAQLHCSGSPHTGTRRHSGDKPGRTGHHPLQTAFPRCCAICAVSGALNGYASCTAIPRTCTRILSG